MRHRTLIGTTVFAITVCAALAYLIWAFLHLAPHSWLAGGAFLFAEILFFGGLLNWGGMMLHRREHPPRGLPLQEHPPPVDVIVTCCGEPFDVIEKSLRAATRIDYPGFKVTVADDGNDADVGTLCRELGFTHLCRHEHEHNKAGNLNFAYTQTSHPFLLVLDCGQIPHPSILKVLIGYFRVETIGFVSTYQGISVPKGDPCSKRDRVFYGSMQPAKNDSNSAVSCGSGVVYRRAALNQIGGFATWSLAENLYSSLLLHAAGWKSVYHPFPLTHGTAPADLAAHVCQRGQWAVDALRLFFWRNPVFTKGLSLSQKMNYFHFGYNHILLGVAYPVFFLLPVWGLFSGRFFIETPALAFVLWRTPYTAGHILLHRLLTDKRHTFRTFRAQTALFQVSLCAILTALFSRRRMPKYTVIGTLRSTPSVLHRLGLASGHLTIISLCMAGILHGHPHRPFTDLQAWVYTAWALWVIWLLVPFVALAAKRTPASDFR